MSNLQLKECDRCGFVFFKSTLRQKNGLWLDNECYDEEKPTKKSLGGEGEVGASEKRANWDTVTVPAESARVIHVVTNSGGINIDYSVAWLVVQASATIATYVLTN